MTVLGGRMSEAAAVWEHRAASDPPLDTTEKGDGVEPTQEPAEPRRFSSRQRTALYLAADGNCAECGVVLARGWHADHMTPYVAGGPTDVINGQALCPPCNLIKGAKLVDELVPELREWQHLALREFERRVDDFLLVATPGAGKTTAALTAAERLMRAGQIKRLVVVVPTAHLRGQWSLAAAQFGIQLDHAFENNHTVIADDYDGTVVTYSAVANEPALWRKMTSDLQYPALVVLDEVHHAGEDGRWGPALMSAFGAARRRLLLSGTPFRSDGRPIPFVTYDAAGCAVASFNYDYGTALADRDVVRPVEFQALNGDMRWLDASGALCDSSLTAALDEHIPGALATAYRHDGQWMPSALRRANDELSEQRKITPDLAGLVIAADQSTAAAYAALLKQITGEQPALAVSDDPDASAVIKQFAASAQRWVVAVKMISEGIDIPRLAVGVYASKIRTEMFVRQVVGRFVRKRGPDDETTAVLFLPSIHSLLEIAARIEKTVDQVLKDNVADSEKQGERPASLIVAPISSTEAIHEVSIYGATVYSDAQIAQARLDRQSYGLPSTFSDSQIAWMMADVRGARLAAAAVDQTVTAVLAPTETLVAQKRALRQVITRKVNRLARLDSREQSHIHTDLNRECKSLLGKATKDQLHRRIELLDIWTEGR